MRDNGRERIAYFGKIPGRSDFIRQPAGLSMTGALDAWLGMVMERLGTGDHARLRYDAMAPVHVAFVGTRRRHAVAGHLVASRDRAGRRYPFLLMHAMDVDEPAAFVAQCPLALQPLWTRMAALAQGAVAHATHGTPATPSALDAIGSAEVEIDGGCASAMAAFLATGTAASLASLLGTDVRRLMLALGLLLQPVLQSGVQQVARSLALPLPADPLARCHVAAFWMELIVPFLRRADVELSLLITTLEDKPTLVVAFSSACVRTLHALIDPALRAAQIVDVGDAAWVDDAVGADVAVRTLATYLEQAQLPLRLARELFLQAFTGAAPA